MKIDLRRKWGYKCMWMSHRHPWSNPNTVVIGTRSTSTNCSFTIGAHVFIAVGILKYLLNVDIKLQKFTLALPLSSAILSSRFSRMLRNTILWLDIRTTLVALKATSLRCSHRRLKSSSIGIMPSLLFWNISTPVQRWMTRTSTGLGQ